MNQLSYEVLVEKIDEFGVFPEDSLGTELDDTITLIGNQNV
jgi:hypothetical protein